MFQLVLSQGQEAPPLKTHLTNSQNSQTYDYHHPIIIIIIISFIIIYHIGYLLMWVTLVFLGESWVQ